MELYIEREREREREREHNLFAFELLICHNITFYLVYFIINLLPVRYY
jgi:hypothetical protein